MISVNNISLYFGGQTLFNKISFSQVLNDNLRVMDLTAITLCKENNLPIQVFNINNGGDLKELVCGGKIGTLVSE